MKPPRQMGWSWPVEGACHMQELHRAATSLRKELRRMTGRPETPAQQYFDDELKALLSETKLFTEVKP